MANIINLTIDGKQVQAADGMNLIDAAELAGIHIPNLCYLKGMKGIGACRMCLVEVEGMKAPMVGCTTKVKEGMVINTKTEAVQEIRKFVIDLILSMHPLDCMTCTKAGVCNLQNYAYDFEIKESSFTRKKFGFAIDDANPFIKRDPDYCILCGRCVRICKNQGTNVLEFMGRGVGSKVATANDKPLQESGCTFCGSCVDVCPVNALLEADRWRKDREWEYEGVNSVCLLCGCGCELNVSAKEGRIMKINAGAEKGKSERFICAYGRFGYDCIEVDTRITVPMVRQNGKLVETTWEEAIGAAAKALKKAGKNAGIISSAGILNEDALTLKALAEAVKTKNYDTTASLYGNAETLITEGADLDKADLFVLVDLNPDQWNRVLPALDAILRRRINSGARLITINSKEPKIASVAALNLIGNEADALRSLAKALIDKGLSGDKKMAAAVSQTNISEDVEKAASYYMEAKNPVILTSTAMYQAAANISLLKGAAVSVPVESNAKGVVMMGLTSAGKSYKEISTGGTSALFAIGVIPLNKRPDVDFLIVQNSHLTGLAKKADIVLPSAAYLEADGTIVDYLGRLRHVSKAVEPAGEARQHREIFADIANAIGADIKPVKESDVKKLTKVKIEPSFKPFEKQKEFSVKVDEMIESMNSSVINGSRLSWLKEAIVCA
ncbi:MAG: molybdopterin-dependent oxidoreductase [Nitrospirae bacterium]|nr:molybdopterin-dependent oxidoreductase [Nitrospirota bacterium]